MESHMQQLHDKATRGIELSASEQAQLEAWYAAQDQTESETLASPQSMHTIGALQAQVDAALGQLASISSQIQTLATQNAALRKENKALHQQLAQTATNHPA